MTVLRSLDSYLGFRELSLTTGLLTVPAEFIFCDSANFSKTIESEIVKEIGIGVRSLRRRVTKNIAAMGNLTKKVDVNNGIALYQYVLGGSVTSASQSGATFLHTFSEDDEVPSATRLQFEYSLGGTSNTTYRFFNGIVESYNLNVAVGNIAQETFNLKFSDHATPNNTVSTIALTQTPPITGNRTSVRLGTSITTVSEVAIKDFTLNVANEIIENRELNTSTVSDFLYGIRSVNGTFNVTYENSTEYAKFENQTYTAIQIRMTSEDTTSGTSHYVNINIPKAYYTAGTPQITNGDQIIQPISFEAIYGSEAAYQIQITVLNGDSAPSK